MTLPRASPRCAFPLLALLGAAGCAEPAPPEPEVCARQLAVSASLHALQCGPSLDFTPIHQYQGDIPGVEDLEDAVALINGTCTGTLIAAKAGPVLLTAGHCVGRGARATVAFNVEAQPDGDPLVTGGTVFEQRTTPDYALIRLDKLPQVTPIALGTTPGDRLAIIAHPRGQPKVITEGRRLTACNGLLYYRDLDTLVGSSGAGVLNRQGQIVAVHSDGDCGQDGGGANWGGTAESIVYASRYLRASDIASR